MDAGINQPERCLITPFFQVMLIVCTTLIIATIFYHRLSFFYTRDPVPTYELITPDKYHEFGSFSNEISVGLYIDEFENFNLADNDFTFTGVVWFLFDPGIISLETLDKFAFSYGQMLFKSSPQTRMIDDKMLVKYVVRVHNYSTLKLDDFPVDNHRLYIEIEHQGLSPSELTFSAPGNNFAAFSNSEIFGWQQYDTGTRAGYFVDELDPFDAQKTTVYPMALFYIDYQRTSTQIIVTLLLPLLIIFYVILFCFSIKEGPTSISLTTGSVTGILAYKFVIANISPKVGYFMLSDYLFFLFLGICIVVFLINICDIYYRVIPLYAKKIIVMAVHALVCGTTAYLVLLA